MDKACGGCAQVSTPNSQGPLPVEKLEDGQWKVLFSSNPDSNFKWVTAAKSKQNIFLVKKNVLNIKISTFYSALLKVEEIHNPLCAPLKKKI